MSALPPNTPQLRRGLGVGTQRAFAATPGRIQSYGDPRTRHERETEVLREGVLPGGLVGVLGHHTHLAEGIAGSFKWAAWTNTIVYAELPVANRVLGRAWFGRREPVRAGLTLDFRRNHRRDSVPAEDADRPDPERFALPPGVHVEIEYGRLCAWIEGRVTDPGRLEALCRAASSVADAIVAEVAAEPELRVDTPVAPPADTERRRWVQAGAARVAWAEPPADVETAVAAYGRVVSGGARHFGLVVGTLLFVVAALCAAACLYVGVQTGLALGGVVSAALAAWLLWRITRAAVGTGRELSAAERDARARPWGLETFVQGYARSRGLTVEDPGAVQRRFDSPVRGRAVAALHGAGGHRLLWLDPDGERWLLRIDDDGVHAEQADWSAAALDRVPAAV
jgi:hypothetical protein